MKITKMLMLEVGTFNDVYQRPYTSHVDGLSLQQLQESTHYGKNLTPAALGAVGADIMRLSSTTSGDVRIANGFDQPRLCVMMEVEFPGTGGMVMVEWLLGYTDHVGISAMFGNSNLAFDPNMRIFFNNVLRGRRVAQSHAYGRQLATNVSGAFQLINGDYRPEITNLHQAPHLMRPQDVFTSMSMHNTRSLLGHEEVLDVRPTHGPERVAVSDRRNTVPGQYLSRMLETWKTQMTNDDVDPAALHSQMAAMVAEPSISRVRSLQQLAVASELRQGGSVSWRELCHAEESGTLEDRATVILAQSQQFRADLSQRGTTEYWNGNGMATLIASQFVQAVPGMMMNLMLTELDFSITNMTLDGTWQVMWGNVQSFNDGDNIDQVQAIEYKLKYELMPGLSRGGIVPMEIHASFNVVGQTFVQIGLDGEPLTPYMAPSFCDGLYAAVRAPSTDTLDHFADGLSRIMTNLESDHYAAGPGAGYGPTDDQFQSTILNAQGNKYENSGSL
jgi:hypothetical protein